MLISDRLSHTALAALAVAAAIGVAAAAPAAAQNARLRPFNELDPSFGTRQDKEKAAAAQAGANAEAEAEQPLTDADGVAVVNEEEAAKGEAPDEALPIDDAEPEFGPYDPLGIRMGSFLLFPEVRLETRYTDNVLESPTLRRTDRATFVEPEIRLLSTWSRHEIEAGIGLTRSYYDEFPSENDDGIDADFRAKLDIRRRTSLEAELAYSTAQESRSDTDFPAGAADRPDETARSAALALEHRINHLTVRLRGKVTQEEFGDVTLIDGDVVRNDDRNNTERELRLRLAYAFRPDVALFIEGSGNEIAFDVRPETGPISDSWGYEVVGGLSFEVGGKISGEVGVGMARQTAEDPALEGIHRPIVNANLTWRATGLTTVAFTAESEIDATTLTDSIGSRTQTLDFSVEHLLRRNVILGAGVNYEVEDFAGSEFESLEVTTSLSAEYLLNRSVALTAEYDHTEFSSTDPDDAYTENRLQVGVRLRR